MERTRAKYFIAVFGKVHECDDDFFRWFNEIFTRSLVNEVGPVCYNNSDWVFQQAQIAVDMIEYVLSLAENTLTTLISCKPRNRREGVKKRMGRNRSRPSPNHVVQVVNKRPLIIIL
jgi:hypothetical protein